MWLLALPSASFAALCLCGAWRANRKETHMTYGDLLRWSEQAQTICGDCGQEYTDGPCPLAGRPHSRADLVRVIR